MIKILSLFTGIGAFEKALKNLNIQYELVTFSEIDKYAIKSYCSMHNETEDKNLGDIRSINANDISKEIEDLGYNNYWKVLNAKDYGIPQNRERVFIISIRKDIDKCSLLRNLNFVDYLILDLKSFTKLTKEDEIIKKLTLIRKIKKLLKKLYAFDIINLLKKVDSYL